MVEVQPTSEHPLPFDLSDEQPKTHKDALAVAANTADLLEELGGTVDFTDSDLHRAAALITGEARDAAPKHVAVSGEAAAISALVRRFDFQAFVDAAQARNYITSKLLQISDCGDAKLELKALELLGKHSDIGLFTERSEITVHHKSSADLENSIKDRIKRLLNSDVVDVEPLISELEDSTPPTVESTPAEEDEDGGS